MRLVELQAATKDRPHVHASVVCPNVATAKRAAKRMIADVGVLHLAWIRIVVDNEYPGTTIYTSEGGHNA